jgi:hypothetical protein
VRRRGQRRPQDARRSVTNDRSKVHFVNTASNSLFQPLRPRSRSAGHRFDDEEHVGGFVVDADRIRRDLHVLRRRLRRFVMPSQALASSMAVRTSYSVTSLTLFLPTLHELGGVATMNRGDAPRIARSHDGCFSLGRFWFRERPFPSFGSPRTESIGFGLGSLSARERTRTSASSSTSARLPSSRGEAASAARSSDSDRHGRAQSDRAATPCGSTSRRASSSPSS